MVFLLSISGLAFAYRAHPTVTKALVGVSTKASIGKLLVNARKVTSLNNKTYRKGFTLYHLLKENTSASTHSFACTGGCLSFWPPLLLLKGMKQPRGTKGVTDKLGVINRPGVGKQITYEAGRFTSSRTTRNRGTPMVTESRPSAVSGTRHLQRLGSPSPSR
jgi:predicted lipoprotein with Yx(FWY)xxD motif